MIASADDTTPGDAGSDALRDAARLLSDHGPAGWRTATLSVDLVARGHGGEGVRYRTTDGTGVYVPEMDHGAIASPMIELFGRLAEGTTFRQVAVHLTVDADGEFDAVARFGLRGSSVGNSYTVVFRKDLPPETLDPEPVVLDPTYAGDPDRAIALLLDQARGDLPPGAAEDQIAAAEAKLGYRLPPDLRAMYALADGGGTIDGWNRYPLTELIGMYEITSAPAESSWPGVWNRVILDADPADTIRRASGHPGWIPIADDSGGNFLVVDLAPARHGRPGQVINVGVDWSTRPGYVAESVTAVLAGRPRPVVSRSDLRLERRGGDIDLEPLRQLPDLQELRLYSDTVNTAELARLRRLRSLSMTAKADLAPLRELPVEHLHVNPESDLTPLAGHPTLRSLGLTQGTTPSDLTPLRTVANLHGLSLADADVADLAVLTDLPSLVYLELSFDQWRQLRPLLDPTGLHAATLSGNPTHRQAIEWRSLLDADPTETAHRTRSARGRL
ncbi:cell wall assembly regulator SMI1 [Micromonospora pisi]|uniref:Cell wall assembly regulator SMI1 n=1 Tax=Micromonospora pisi TaxID=589240 RepID=A0A495JVN4_9ACTN|nr:SMI1/KNR4 family protein [Micromonospora pisi]RKR93037.1 cell wall assembly regulator SMI1 [Micromonospora pisi]